MGRSVISRQLAAGALALVIAGGAGAAARPRADQTPGQTFRTGTDVVRLSITVATTDGKLIGGLDKTLFQVFEDGALQDVSFFSADRQPVALSILLDTSASMEPKLAVAKEAASGFARRLSPEDLAQVLQFESRVEVVQDFTNDAAKLEAAIRRTNVGGSTSLHNALYVALTNFKKARLQGTDTVIRRQAIVVLSDGEDTSSLMDYDEVLGLAKRSDVIVYAIGLKSKAEAKAKGFSEATYELRTLADETGGDLFTVEDITQLGPIYQRIADELMNQYTVGYSSRNPKKDGAWRAVQVRVGQPNTVARTKRGYYGPTMGLSPAARAMDQR
jgi:Ca-activated chloride channel family protein